MHDSGIPAGSTTRAKIRKKSPGKKDAVGKSAAQQRVTGKSIVEEFLPTIRHLAHKMAKGFGNDHIVDDLVSAGVTGLLEILEKYDPSKAKLCTFAYLRIRGAMIDELRSMDWFPRSVRVKARKIREAAMRFEHEVGRRPDEEEMAREMNMDRNKFLSMLKSCGSLSMVSIDEVSDEAGEGGDETSGCLVDDYGNPQRHAEARELRKIIAGEIGKLSEKQRKTVKLYYGEDMNMREVAMALGVTEARVSQIHTQAIASLRPLMSKYFTHE
jgi:RNA polymerase sigma factor FliA